MIYRLSARRARSWAGSTTWPSSVSPFDVHVVIANKDDVARAGAEAAIDRVVAVAGMEGALPSVVGGLVDKPVIAVPTSVGYGTGAQGLAALMAMLNSCASGVTVVNIDNGFGAGYAASLINRL